MVILVPPVVPSPLKHKRLKDESRATVLKTEEY